VEEVDIVLILEKAIRARGKFSLIKISRQRDHSSNSQTSATNQKKNLKKYLSNPSTKPIKMTERSIVISEAHQIFDTEEEVQNTSMNLKLKDFKKVFEEKKNSRKKDIYSTSSQLSSHSRVAGNPHCSSMDKQETEEKTVRWATQEDEEMSGQKGQKPNYTTRDNLDLNEWNLIEIFQEFEKEKYGGKLMGKATTQNKDLVSKLDLKKFKQTVGKMESQEEREKRLFNLIKQRQSQWNQSLIFNQDTNEMNRDQMIDFENINTSTFGYAINHNAQRSADQHPLDQENVLTSTMNSKMNKRYINNHLINSDSSIDDEMMGGKSVHSLILPTDINEHIMYTQKSNTESDMEPIMIYAGDTEEEPPLKLELLQRILCRKLKNIEIYHLKTGYMAFIQNCILIKKSLNLFQVLSKAFQKRLFSYSSVIYTSLRHLHGLSILQKTIEKHSLKSAVVKLISVVNRSRQVEEGLVKLKHVLLRQQMVIEFWEKLKRMNDDRSSTSLLAPLQNKSIGDIISREEIKQGWKLLKRAVKQLIRRAKRQAMDDIRGVREMEEEKGEEDQKKGEEDQKKGEEDQEKEEENKVLKGVKLFMVLERRVGREKRGVLQKWRKYIDSRDDLLTVNQSTMHQILKRVIAKFEISWISKRFYCWKYSSNALETNSQIWQTDEVEFKQHVEWNEASIQTDWIEVFKEDAETSTDPIIKQTNEASTEPWDDYS
jgi:hypothetical protein